MPKIFISYSRKNNEIMTKFVKLLGYGCEVWYDQARDGINAGEDWWERIVSEIESCDHFVYLLSPQSIESKVCRDELDKALEFGSHIIPVWIIAETGLPEKIANLHTIDASDNKFTEAIGRIYGLILKSTIIIQRALTEEHHKTDLALLKIYWQIVDTNFLQTLEQYISIDSLSEIEQRKSDLFQLISTDETRFHDNKLTGHYITIYALLEKIQRDIENPVGEKFLEIEDEVRNFRVNFIHLLKTNYPEHHLF